MDLLEYQASNSSRSTVCQCRRAANHHHRREGLEPVLAYIGASRHRPALEARGVRVGRNPTQVSELDVEILRTRV
jgi:hypothetical protein